MLRLGDALDAGSMTPSLSILFARRFRCWIIELFAQDLMSLDVLDAGLVSGA